MISDETKRKAKERAVSEFKRFVAIALYLWVLLSLFEIHRYAVLREFKLSTLSGYKIGFAGINALVLGKVILIGQALHFGERFKDKRLIYSVLFLSAVFASLLVCFEVAEDVITGMIRGKSFMDSIPQMAGGGLEGKLIYGFMAFVVLIPFFLFTEVQRVIGKDKLRSLILQDRAKAVEESAKADAA